MQPIRVFAFFVISSCLLLACSDDEPKEDPPNLELAAACVEYCDAIAVSCTGANEQFESTAACNTYCSSTGSFGLGTKDDADGNSVSCRTYHTGAAAEDPGTHCGHAGAVGGGVCGSYCDNYCDMAMTHCTGDNELYADKTACLAYCGADGAAWADGTEGATDGNTTNCRIYHLGAAASDASTHCPHAGPSGAAVCGTYCENYCELAMTHCDAGNALYANQGECETACADFAETGAPGDADGDTVQCRIYHLGAAIADAATHCPHAGEDGGGVCVNPESLSVTFVTTEKGGSFAPKNMVAVWLEETDGTFVKTIGRWAETHRVDLIEWMSGSGDDNDAVSGATRANHDGTLSIDFNITAAALPDAVYNIRMELSDGKTSNANQNHQGTFSFNKNGTANIENIGAQDGFESIKIDYSGR